MLDVSKCIKDSLHEVWRTDYIETSMGWLSIRNNNFTLGPKYIISVNFAHEELNIDYITRYSFDGNMDLIQKIYKSCNGISLFGGRFYIPGVRAGLKPKDELDYFNMPFDMNVCSGSEYPAHAPVFGLVAGISWRRISGKSHVLHDIIDSSGSIISGFFFESNQIIESYNDVYNWISRRSRDSMQLFIEDANSRGCLRDFPSLASQGTY